MKKLILTATTILISSAIGINGNNTVSPDLSQVIFPSLPYIEQPAELKEPTETAEIETAKPAETVEPIEIEYTETIQPEEPAETKSLEEQLIEEGFIIVYERPQNDNEIYCRKGMSLEEWWTINPPDDSAYDDWDDENNSPDII